MTSQEILEYNKRCAEFLGGELYIPKPWYYFPKYEEHYYFKNRYEPNRFTLKMMKFHSDWNWIKSILEKISSLNEDDFSDETQQAFEDLLDLSLFSSKEAVVQAINQFLIWYEQNKIT